MGKNCVILADRHQTMLEGLRDLLETEFTTIMMVADKNSLFEAIDKIHPDLVVVDLSLNISGEVNIARDLNDRYPKLKFIVISEHDDLSDAQSVIAAGASGFVLKRTIVDDLFEATEKVTEGQTFISSSLQV